MSHWQNESRRIGIPVTSPVISPERRCTHPEARHVDHIEEQQEPGGAVGLAHEPRGKSGSLSLKKRFFRRLSSSTPQSSSHKKGFASYLDRVLGRSLQGEERGMSIDKPPDRLPEKPGPRPHGLLQRRHTDQVGSSSGLLRSTTPTPRRRQSPSQAMTYRGQVERYE